MAGDWIKMRGNLWDDPRIAKMCDLTDQSEAAVVGGLYWLWAAADQHSEDGVMPGLSVSSINRKTGIKGFGEALLVIGWMADHPEGIRIVRFEEHNGSSAKRRCSDAQRKASVRSLSASEADNSGNSAELEKEKEKEKNKKELLTHTENNLVIPTQAGAVCVLLKSKGFGSVNPSHQGLIDLLNAGATIGVFDAAADTAKEKNKDFAYVLGIVKRQMQSSIDLASQPRASPTTNETNYQKSVRERVAEFAPGVAKQTIEVLNVIAA
jgi:hypothetical protein